MTYPPFAWPPLVEPTALPPNGAAGGDLAGTYPNPTVPGLFASGRVLQIVRTESSTLATTAALIPMDNTIPQSGEGSAYANIDTTITPQRATSTLLVQVFIPYTSLSILGQLIGALFRDAATDAIAANTTTFEAGSASWRLRSFEIIATVAAGSVAPTTFKLRYGGGAAGSCYILSAGGTGYFGGAAAKAIMTVTEIAA